MNGKQYLKNSLPVILINLLGMTALALFLSTGGVGIQMILLIAAVWVITVVCYLSVVYF